MMKKTVRSVIGICLVLSLMVQPFYSAGAEIHTHTDYSTQEILKIMEGIILWEKNRQRIAADDPLFQDPFLADTGTTNTDWFAVGIGRSGYEDDYSAYLAVTADDITRKYKAIGGMDKSKSTEFHRVALAVLAMGGDPTNIGINVEGTPVNLIADGTYYRGRTVPLERQGVNAVIFALIALDSLRYQIPEDAVDTREGLLLKLLNFQNPDGGFNLSGDANESSDADLTAMSVQALAPYYNSEERYSCTRQSGSEERSVREAVDDVLAWLSAEQLADGGFESGGTAAAESCAQVITALTALSIDPGSDERFIKEGNTVLDALMGYQMKDGGFIHSTVFDENNPTSSPDESNVMASQQALYALTALCRYYGNLRTLYDFREEQPDELKEQLKNLEERIAGLDQRQSGSDENIRAVYENYLEIPVSERSYVSNYAKLADMMETAGIENDSEPLAAKMGVSTEGRGSVLSLFGDEVSLEINTRFTEEDEKAALALADPVTTEAYVTVVKLLRKLEYAENKDEYQQLGAHLEVKKQEIDQLKEEIAAINQEVLDNLYPLDQISEKDRAKVEEIQSRIEKLSSYDQEQILQYEDIEQASTRIRNQASARMMSMIIVIVIAGLVIVVIIRIRKRKIKKLEELQPTDEDDDVDEEEED